MLAPGGRAVFMDVVAPERPVLDSFLQTLEMLRDPSHVRNYTVSEWTRFLAAAGFTPGTVDSAPSPSRFRELDRAHQYAGAACRGDPLLAGAGRGRCERAFLRSKPTAASRSTRQASRRRLDGKKRRMMRVIGLAGWSGAGKTTLIVRLIPELKARGLSVSTLKHAHHNFDVDQPGKDSFRHREAGAHEVMIASSNRFALMHELRGAPEPPLATLICEARTRRSPDHRRIQGRPSRETGSASGGKRQAVSFSLTIPQIKAIASDEPAVGGLFKSALPYAHLDDIPGIADLVLKFAEPVDETLRQLSASR